MRDNRIVPQALAEFRYPNEDGRDLMVLMTSGRLQWMQQLGFPSVEKGNANSANEGNPMYVGLISQESIQSGEADEKTQQKKVKIRKRQMRQKKTKIKVLKIFMIDCCWWSPQELMRKK